MGVAYADLRARGFEPRRVTLLELVQTVAEVAEDEREVVATVLHLLRSRRVQLRGNFRGVEVEKLR